ncbi:MAG: winged-helix domain-containing protein, partial [Clostridia bacterium]
MAGYVSEAVIKRLPAYYRHLKELEKEHVEQISSQGLGDRMLLTASQIRQDINCFGGFGRQGYGYSVTSLREHIGRILGVD